MRLLCLHGAPGVGKLSVARELRVLTDAILVHDHLIIDAATSVFSFGTTGFSKLRSLLFARLLDAAVATRSEIIVTHADDVFWAPPFDALLESAANSGYEILHVLLVCDEAEHGRRISNPSRARYQKITDIERLQRLVAAGEFEPLSPDRADIVLDTTNLLPSNTASILHEWARPSEGRAVRASLWRGK